MTTAPIVNLNGTSATMLLEQNLTALRGLQSALSLLCEAAPNGRDFQTAPMGTFARAQSEHITRIARIESVMSEIETIAMNISDQL